MNISQIAADNRSFHFAPDSAIWEINRERVLLLTGVKVLLMQIAHPMVAEAVYNHSYVFKKPLLRLHRTLKLTLGMVFGTKSEVAQAIAEIEQAHRPAVGKLEQGVGIHAAGTSYNPRHPEQALWVFATLVEGAISGYETLVAPLSPIRKQEMLDNSSQIATWMGIPQQYIPASYDDLVTYMQDAIDSQIVIVSDKARKIAPFITTQSIPLVNIMSYPIVHMNIALLPEKLRQQYGYQLGSRENTVIQGVFGLSRRVTPRFPHFIRFAPEYHRAMRLQQLS